MDVLFVQNDLERFLEVPSQEQISLYLTSGLFIFIDQETLQIQSEGKKFLFDIQFLKEKVPNFQELTFHLHGKLENQAVFSLRIAKILTDLFTPQKMKDNTEYSVAAALAYSTAGFHQSNLFCSKCGQKTSFLNNLNTNLTCTNCNVEIYPQISMAIIALITYKNKMLLCHRYGVVYANITGFVELAETLENALIREIHEEIGISAEQIKQIRQIYASQPWVSEYGLNLMIPYVVELQSEAQWISTDEIKDCKWVEFQDWKKSVLGEVDWQIPAKGTIARWMQESFWEGQGQII